MLTPFDQLESQISRTDQQLMYYLILEQKETNRLLRGLTGKKSDEETTELKRQDLMKEFAKLENKPQGWNKWDTDKMRKYLREVS